MFRRPKEVTDECALLRELLLAQPDGALSAADAARLEEHLPQCPTCAREAALLADLAALLRRDPLPLTEIQLPAGEQIARSIVEAEAQERRLLLPPPRLLGWTAALAAATVLAVIVVRAPQPRPQLPAVTQPASAGFWIEDDERTGRDVIVAPAAALSRRGS